MSAYQRKDQRPDPAAAAAAKFDRSGLGGALSAARKLCRKHLEKAVKAFKRNDYANAALKAADAAESDPSCGQAFHILGLSLEYLGDMAQAVRMYERAFALDPADPDLVLHLGLAAMKMGLLDGAESAFRLYCEAAPDQPHGWNNLATVLRETGRHDDAIDLVRGALMRLPAEPLLWNTLGTILAEQARFAEADIFYNEALRLDPAFSKAWHNLGYSQHHQGLREDALVSYEKALKIPMPPHERAEIEHSRSLCLLAMGRIAEGFPAYEVRHSPHHRAYAPVAVAAPRWAGEDLDGKTILVVGEQGLGDEILFGTVLPDLLSMTGNTGRVMAALDHRLVAPFQRAWQRIRFGGYQSVKHQGRDVRIVNWAEGDAKPDFWIEMGGLLPHFRKDLADFPARNLLVPDHDRLAAFRAALGEDKRPLVGLGFRSMLTSGTRAKYFAGIEAWAPILKTPGVRFVNLQYGDCAKEIAFARDRWGVTVETIAGLDLKQDIDGALALSCACDLVISASTATAQIAAAGGVETWMFNAAPAWPQLGTQSYPWYMQTRAFAPEAFGDWSGVMGEIADALEAWSAAKA
jgi:Flp pilus assembly protein TadD